VSSNNWQFWIDRGGTFTDVVALRPDGGIETAKLLSEDPEHYVDAAAEGIRRLAAAGDTIEAVKMGTTVATNALLERHGTPTVLVVTEGFRDALAIGYQNRPDIFAQAARSGTVRIHGSWDAPVWLRACGRRHWSAGGRCAT